MIKSLNFEISHENLNLKRKYDSGYFLQKTFLESV